MKSPFKNIKAGDLILPIEGKGIATFFIISFEHLDRHKYSVRVWDMKQNKKNDFRVVLGSCGNALFATDGAIWPNSHSCNQNYTVACLTDSEVLVESNP